MAIPTMKRLDDWLYSHDGCEVRERVAIDQRDNLHAIATEMKAENERLRKIVRVVVRTCNMIDETGTHEDRCEPSVMSGPTWSKVGYMCGLGSTSATNLCREFDVDPDHDAGEATK